MSLIAAGTVAAALFVTPIAGLAWRLPWSRLGPLLASESALNALWLSAVTSVVATIFSVLLGVPLAWILARADFAGLRLLRAAVTLPMVLPPVVAGAALLIAFGRRGAFGSLLFDATGFVLPFSLWGVVLANTFVAMPFLVLTVEGAFRGLDPRYEEAASTMGARPFRVFWRVAIPMVSPSLLAGTVLAWARALGEFGATITFAGNLSGRTQTLPLAVFQELERDRDTAVALSAILLTISFVLIVSLRDRWWPTRVQ